MMTLTVTLTDTSRSGHDIYETICRPPNFHPILSYLSLYLGRLALSISANVLWLPDSRRLRGQGTRLWGIEDRLWGPTEDARPTQSDSNLFVGPISTSWFHEHSYKYME